ncbi:hypothetical protein CBL_11452 [Carabus blaptoides fortunei]
MSGALSTIAIGYLSSETTRTITSTTTTATPTTINYVHHYNIHLATIASSVTSLFNYTEYWRRNSRSSHGVNVQVHSPFSQSISAPHYGYTIQCTPAQPQQSSSPLLQDSVAAR